MNVIKNQWADSHYQPTSLQMATALASALRMGLVSCESAEHFINEWSSYFASIQSSLDRDPIRANPLPDLIAQAASSNAFIYSFQFVITHPPPLPSGVYCDSYFL